MDTLTGIDDSCFGKVFHFQRTWFDLSQ